MTQAERAALLRNRFFTLFPHQKTRSFTGVQKAASEPVPERNKHWSGTYCLTPSLRPKEIKIVEWVHQPDEHEEPLLRRKYRKEGLSAIGAIAEKLKRPEKVRNAVALEPRWQ